MPVGRWEYNIKVALREVECEMQGFNLLRIGASVAETCFIQGCSELLRLHNVDVTWAIYVYGVHVE